MSNLMEDLKNLAVRAGVPEALLRKMMLPEIFRYAAELTDVVSNKTDDYSVVAATDLGLGKIFTMSHADAKVFTLPELSAGDVGKPITLLKKGAGKVTVQAHTGQKIADSPESDGATTGQIYDDVAGEVYASITLMAVTTTLWIIIGLDGTWTVA